MVREQPVAGRAQGMDPVAASAGAQYGAAQRLRIQHLDVRADEWSQRSRAAFVEAYAGGDPSPAHLLLLGAFTGGLSYILNAVRSLCLAGENRFARSRAMCAILCALQLAALGVTWSGWLSILPVTANIAATIGGYTHNARTIRLTGMLINSPLWILYDVMVGSWAGILDELVSEASMLLSIVRYGWKALGSDGADRPAP